MRKITAIAAAAFALTALGACAAPRTTPAAAIHSAAPAATTQPAPADPAPEPSPDGTYAGACDYTLGDDPVGGTAVATGDIQVKNTGNIGTTLKLVITWPQQGYSPLRKTKTIHLATGASRDVQFNYPLTSNQLDNLQNWQDGHGYADGCTYRSTIIGTFGSPAS